MAISVRVSIRDKTGKDFRTTEIARISSMSKLDTERLARACEKVIQQTIMTKSAHPTGHLASKFLAGSIPNGWGVGDIATLDTEVPYWNHVDKGSEGIGANWNHFLPKGFWFNGQWVVDGEEGFSGIKPKTPIQALNYISETLAQMQSLTPIILKQGK